MPDLIFVYGTLRPGHAPVEIADVVSTWTRVGTGTVRGRLYDLGPYPGAVLGDRSAPEVHGEVFALSYHPESLARLDEYEEFSPQDPEGSLFRRLRTTVTLPGGLQKRCWVYAYNENRVQREKRS